MNRISETIKRWRLLFAEPDVRRTYSQEQLDAELLASELAIERLAQAARVMLDDAIEVGDNNYEMSILCYYELKAALEPFREL